MYQYNIKTITKTILKINGFKKIKFKINLSY